MMPPDKYWYHVSSVAEGLPYKYVIAFGDIVLFKLVKNNPFKTHKAATHIEPSLSEAKVGKVAEWEGLQGTIAFMGAVIHALLRARPLSRTQKYVQPGLLLYVQHAWFCTPRVGGVIV